MFGAGPSRTQAGGATAWFLSHRICEAMRSVDLAPYVSDGGAAEVDETYFGVRKGAVKPRARV